MVLNYSDTGNTPSFHLFLLLFLPFKKKKSLRVVSVPVSKQFKTMLLFSSIYIYNIAILVYIYIYNMLQFYLNYKGMWVIIKLYGLHKDCAFPVSIKLWGWGKGVLRKHLAIKIHVDI